jgi:hypothetical protein
MPKAASTDVLDGSLNVIRQATRMVALAAEPASFAAADGAKLAEATLTTADFTLAAGDVSGRKVTVAAKSGLAVLAAGTANHVALLDTATSRLLYVTTCPNQSLAPGGVVSIAPWSIEIAAPV